MEMRDIIADIDWEVTERADSAAKGIVGNKGQQAGRQAQRRTGFSAWHFQLTDAGGYVFVIN
jgi:hypothetical protein